MIGIILLGIAAAVSILGIFKNNTPKPGQKAILGLNVTGFVLLAFAMLTFVLGITKQVLDAQASAQNIKKAHDETKKLTDLVAKTKTQVGRIIISASEGVRREVASLFVDELRDRPADVVFHGHQLEVTPGDEIEWFFVESQREGVRGLLRVGETEFEMVTDRGGKGSMRVVGNPSKKLPVSIRTAARTKPGGVKITVTSTVRSSELAKMLQNVVDEIPDPPLTESDSH